jgi:hypothetical protein
VPRASRTTVPIVATVLLAVAAGVVIIHHAAAGTTPPATTTTSVPATTSTTVPPTTTTTIRAGDLPQTTTEPPSRTPSLDTRMRMLVRAIANDDPRLAYGAFFPLAAYLQTKAGYGNDEDWHYRLIGHFGQDIAALHAAFGPHAKRARLVSYSIDSATATWVLPGEEGNKGPYWRAYYTTVTYGIGRGTGTFPITTMISWRGEWYVVHLTGFNS